MSKQKRKKTNSKSSIGDKIKTVIVILYVLVTIGGVSEIIKQLKAGKKQEAIENIGALIFIYSPFIIIALGGLALWAIRALYIVIHRKLLLKSSRKDRRNNCRSERFQEPNDSNNCELRVQEADIQKDKDQIENDNNVISNHDSEELINNSNRYRVPVTDVQKGRGYLGVENIFNSNPDIDEYFSEAGRLVIEADRASIGMLQRKLNIGFNRAYRIMEQLEEYHVISGIEGISPKSVNIMSMGEFDELLDELKVNKKEDQSLQGQLKDYLQDRDPEEIQEDQRLLSQLTENDYYDLDYMENTLITKAEDEIKFQFLSLLMEKYPSSVLRMILVDPSGFDMVQYEGKRWLLCPVINNIEKAKEVMKYVIKDIDRRKSKLISSKTSSVEAFNKCAMGIENPLVRLIIIINDYEQFRYEYQFNNQLFEIITQGKKVGVHTVIYSNLTEKNLQLGELKDVIQVVDSSNSINPTLDILPISKDIFRTDQKVTLAEIDTMNGIEFEEFCKKLLEANGFVKVSVTKASGDYGADVIAHNSLGIRYVIQCKRYQGKVGEDAVREVYASKNVYTADVAVVLTNSTFTEAAIKLASGTKVRLWDRKQMIKMMQNLA